jgi:broad specificity phosphatase PhoE
VPRVTLVRHGEASAGWGDDPDPGLSELGARQAAAVAEALAPLGPQAVLTSPLRRCRETAAPLAARWGVEPVVTHPVAEIPSPPGVGLDERSAWLLSLSDRRWSDADPATRQWCAEVVAAVTGLGEDTVVFSHFVAINVVLGAALGDDRVFVARLANCSRTIVDVVDGRLVLVEVGAEADSRIG